MKKTSPHLHKAKTEMTLGMLAAEDRRQRTTAPALHRDRGKEDERMKVPAELLNDVKKQWDALGQNVYEIAMINYATGKKLEDVQGWQMFESHGLERVLYMNTCREENIYIRALPTARHNVIMLDDLRDDGLQYLRGIYPLACVVETSTDEAGPNYQAWLRLAERHDKPERMLVERALLHELKSNGYHADIGAADGMHLGRLVGFKNLGFENKKDRNHIVRLVESEGKTLLHSTTDDLLERGRQIPAPVKASNKEGFAGDLAEIRSHEYERIGIIQYFKDKILPSVHLDEPDKSKVDFYLARQLARNGFSEKDARRVLLEHGPNDVSRKEQPADYICRTVASAMAHSSPPTQGGGCGSAGGASPPARSTVPATPPRLRFGVRPRYASVPAADQPHQPEQQQAAYAPPVMPSGGRTGRKLLGTISPDGKIEFADEPAFDISLELCQPTGAADPLDQTQTQDTPATSGPKL